MPFMVEDKPKHKPVIPRSYFGHISAESCCVIARQLREAYRSDPTGRAHTAEMVALARHWGVDIEIIQRIEFHYRHVHRANLGNRAGEGLSA